MNTLYGKKPTKTFCFSFLFWKKKFSKLSSFPSISHIHLSIVFLWLIFTYSLRTLWSSLKITALPPTRSPFFMFKHGYSKYCSYVVQILSTFTDILNILKFCPSSSLQSRILFTLRNLSFITINPGSASILNDMCVQHGFLNVYSLTRFLSTLAQFSPLANNLEIICYVKAKLSSST